MYVIVSFVLIALTVFALVDIITRDESRVKHLPKIVWVLLVVFLPLLGIILWFAIGRDYDSGHREAISFGDPRRWARPDSQPRRPPVDSRSTEQQLADLESEIDYYSEHGVEKPKRPDSQA